MGRRHRALRRVLGLAAAAPLLHAAAATAQAPAPQVLDRDLAVRTAASGLSLPTTMAFLGRGDLLVLEKATGQVRRVVNGQVRGAVLDLPVNSASERGLLGIALHPRFRRTGFAYLFWTESRTGADSTALADVRPMANRIDRFRWNGEALEFDRPILRFRAFQADEGQPLRGNHNGGVLRFGPDGKLYAIVGDTGRRGQLQNLAAGPFGPGLNDDQFGGPEPDDLHRTGVIVRLNPDGSSPRDNPFFAAGRAAGGEVGANLQRIFAYGIRNSFGMDFDPRSGDLWEQENGDDAFSELNRVEPGMNSGWIQVMGPVARVAQFKAIETDPTTGRPDAPNGYLGLQQVRWPPANLPDTPEQALERLVQLPGARYGDPELSWKYEVGPGGIGFLRGRGLGRDYAGDLFMGGSTARLQGGHLFRIPLARNREGVATSDPRLADGVADNLRKWDLTESESLLFGRDFGVVTDVQTGPEGDLYVVSLSTGTIYAIGRAGREPRLR